MISGVENDAFWDFYWEMRLQAMETLGKREAILTGSRLIRRLAETAPGRARMLEFGCGEGQIIGNLAEAHAQVRGTSESAGIDYLHSSIMKARRDYPRLTFVEGDFTDPLLLERLGHFEIALLVNALHEVFSATRASELDEVDVPAAKERVARALEAASQRLNPGGYLLLFDGLEPPGDPQQPVRLRFHEPLARAHFETFAREYQPFHIRYRSLSAERVELSQHHFARYIDKSIFLGKKLWQTERLESYQYFTEDEFRAAFQRAGLQIEELRVLTVNEDKWQDTVEIETPGIAFPAEHILIVAKKEAA